MVLVFEMPTDGAIEIAGMSLLKIAGLMSFGLTVVMVMMGGEMKAAPGFHIAVLFYIAWVVLSFTWTTMPEPYEITQAISSDQSLKNNMYILMVSLLMFQLAGTETDLRNLYAAFLLGSFGLVYLMLRDYQSAAETVRYEIKKFDANEVSVKLAMVVPLAIYLITQGKHWLLRLVGIAYLPAVVFTILITGSRTGSIVLVIGLLGFWPVVRRASVLGKVLAVVAVVGLLLGMASLVPEKTIERIFSTGKEISTGTFNERSIIWTNAYEELANSPLYGHGLGSFRRIVSKYNVGYTAHNSYMAIAAEQGIIGVCLYLAVIGFAFAHALRLPPDDRVLMLSMLVIVTLGQMSLTLSDRMYVWFAYALVVLSSTIKNNKVSIRT